MSYFTRGDFKTVNQTSSAFSAFHMKVYKNARVSRKVYEKFDDKKHTSSWLSKTFANRANKLRDTRTRYVYTRSA